MDKNPAQKQLFVSHIHEEAPLAVTLKNWIVPSFSGQCKVFVSSDGDNIPPGDRWLDRIEDALAESSAFLVLCSPVSITRPWINFETGCGWLRKIPVILLCHSGQKIGELPLPLSLLQSLELESESVVPDLLSGLAKHFGFPEVPPIDEQKMTSELLTAVASIRQGEGKISAKPSALTDDISPEALEILKFFGALPSNCKITTLELAQHFSMRENRMEYFIDRLLKTGWIFFIGHKPTTYFLTSRGREYLFERGLL